MLNIDDMVVRFDNREGFSLVDYEIVGLPVWRLSLLVQTLDESPIAATEEFSLRLVEEGFTDTKSISSLLGLDEKIVISTASDLVREDAISSAAGEIRLTKKGRDILKNVSITKPYEHQIGITFDAMLREPKLFEYYQLFEPKALRDEGIRAINPKPNKKPEPDDLNVDQVEEQIKKLVKKAEATRLLRIKAVTSRRVLYQKAVMLIFKANQGSEIQVGFTVDRRLSDEHEFQFAKMDGIKRLGIEVSIAEGAKQSPGQEILGKRKGQRLEKEASSNFDKTQSLGQELSEVRGKISDALSDVEASDKTVADSDAASNLIRQLIADKERLENAAKQFSVRMVSVYEHPDFLWDALSTAQKRILIVSPWITKAVVDRGFLKILERQLRAGVSALIGYGLDERLHEPPAVTSAEEELLELADRHDGLTMRRLGDTHAKILIKDDEYMITTSFNWLSFRGNPKRAFREEWGTFVGIPEMIEEQYTVLEKRIVGRKKKIQLNKKN